MTSRTAAMIVGVISSTAVLGADSLLLRDGRRVEGQLIAVRENIIEFEARERGSVGGRERIRIDRADVRRIDFDDFERESYRDRVPDRDRGRDRDQGQDLYRPSGLRERAVLVDATTPWTDTGLEVREGQSVYFQTNGRVHWGPGRNDGAEGEHDSPYNASRPIPSRPGAALIGRVGDSREYFFIGDEKGSFRMQSSGRLYLGINDDNLQDNSGAFRVTIAY
jgi:hypothetical protein